MRGAMITYFARVNSRLACRPRKSDTHPLDSLVLLQ